MATFFLFGRYSAEALSKVSAERTQKAHKLIEGLGGKVVGIYGLLGEHDLVIITELPSMTEAVKASIALRRETNISFFTTAAMPVEQFDQIVGEM